MPRNPPPIPKPAPIPAQQLADVKRLHEAGEGRNAIMAALGMTRYKVNRIASELGLSFDRRATAVAVAAKEIDAKERRQSIADECYADYQKIRAKYFTAYVWVGNGKEGPARLNLDEPDAPALAKYVTASAILIDKMVILEKMNADTGVAPVQSMLGRLLDKLDLNDA